MMKHLAAIDFGLSNTDVVVQAGDTRRIAMVPSPEIANEIHLRSAIRATGHELEEFERIAITGGQHGRIPDRIGRTRVMHANEITALGLGGLALADADTALIVSAGTGTAIVAARPGDVRHASGSAVGGGTLLGLSRLILGTADVHEIERLARAGNPAGADLTLTDAVGGAIGRLPADATAVNFGRVARGVTPSREDTAAALVTLVAQTISLIAINVARAEQLSPIVFVGHLMDMPSMRVACEKVAELYGVHFVVPAGCGSATVLGALIMLQRGDPV